MAANKKPIAETRLAKTSEGFTQVKNIVVSIAIVLLIGIITHLIFREMRKKYIIVDAVEVPDLLVQKGYTGAVVARYLIDEMNRINYVAEDSATYTLNPHDSGPTIGISKDMTDLNFQIPETEISFSSIVTFFRIYFNKKSDTINGEIIIDKDNDTDIATINFRYGQLVIRRTTTLKDLNSGIKSVALDLLKIIRPVTVANYFYAKSNFLDARAILKNNLPHFSSLDKSEALLVLGLIETNKSKRDTAKAAMYFNMSVKENRSNAAAYNSLGLLRRTQKNDKLAEKSFLNAIRANNKFASAYVNLGILKKENNDTVKAEYYFNEAIKQNYTSASYAFINLGIIKKFKGDFIGAEKDFQEAIDIAPLHTDGYINLGLLKRDQGFLPEAEEMYTQALKINPKDYFIYNILGILKRDQGLYEEATSLFEKAILMEPNRPAYGYNNIGHIRRDEGLNEKASQMYLNSCTISPYAPNSFAYLGLLKAGENDTKSAHDLYRKAIKIDKTGANAYAYLALLEENNNNPDKAIFLYKKSIKVNPNFVDAYIYWSIFERSRGDSLRATNLQKRAMSICPTNTAYAYMSYGNLKRDQKHYDEAIEMYKNAIKINDKCLYGRINLIRLLHKNGLKQEAEINYTEATKIHPNNKALLLLKKELKDSNHIPERHKYVVKSTRHRP